jgi:flagellar hook-associated protein 1 FlgK
VANINAAEGNMPNDLLDKRDVLINKVAALADISVLQQSDGSVSMFIGSGQPLVVAGDSTPIKLVSSRFDQADKTIEINGQDVTDILSGGEIKGILRFKSEILDPAKQQLGLVAVSMATQFNTISQSGYDFNGNEGLAFFDFGDVPPVVQVQGQSNDPALEVNASFVAPASAASLGAVYRLDVTGIAPSTYTLTNLTDNTKKTGLKDSDLNGKTDPPNTANKAGFYIGVTGSVTIGDSFTISPTYNAAKGIRVNPEITGPEQIAASGTEVIPKTDPPTYIFGGPGDNSNALRLAAIESSQNGTVSLTESYGNLVSTVGSKTHIASISRTAQETLLKQAQTAKENANGVNLDQEAADLIKFQQAYQAAAQTISLAKELFQTMMSAMQ